jgi:hypothetical protein
MSGGGFCSAVGDWKGTAEVFDGTGRFLGGGVDQRHVTTPEGEGKVRIELSFTGPFSFAGHYVIEDRGDHRLYRGPVNVGFAEALGDDAVQADNYWQAIGMSQRFLLMVTPDGHRQLSLALLSRGERLCYAVVGENHKQLVCGPDAPSFPPSAVDRASVDLASDPTAGRGQLLLHRPGRWRGTVRVTDGALGAADELPLEQTVTREGDRIAIRTVGGRFAPEPYRCLLRSDGWHAWTTDGPVAGSYSLSGGRAASGQLHYLADELRVWRREVVSHDGALKAVVDNWYRGGRRVGTQHGFLTFEPA